MPSAHSEEGSLSARCLTHASVFGLRNGPSRCRCRKSLRDARFTTYLPQDVALATGVTYCNELRQRTKAVPIGTVGCCSWPAMLNARVVEYRLQAPY